MKICHLVYFTVCACLALPLNADARERFADRYNISYITMKDGLPHNMIDDICKDSNGFLWISTAGSGLARYDGYEFINFSPNAIHCKLKSNFINNVCEDPHLRLWIVSEEGTEILDLATMQLTTPDDPKGLLAEILSKPAFVVTCDSQGCIWLQSGGALHRITFNDTGSVESLSTLDLPELIEPRIVLKDIDQDGKIWTAIAGTVYKIVPDASGGLRKNPVSGSLVFQARRMIMDMLAKENEVWIATDLGLFRYNRNSDVVKRYMAVDSDPRSMTQNFVTSLAVTSDKQLIAGTLLGANIYDPLTDDFERFMLAEKDKTGLNSNFINCIMVNGEDIWFGTESGGLNRLSPKRLALRNYRHDMNDPSSLSANPVNAIFEDAGGDLWVGTIEGGLNRKEKGEEGFTHYKMERGEIGHNSVSSIAADDRGRLWVGTWGGGVNILDIRSNGRPYREIRTIPDTDFPIPFIGVLMHDPANSGMWIGTQHGLFFYDLETDNMISPFSGADNIRGCLGAVIDRDNRLWIGSTQGVYIVDLTSRSPGAVDGEFEYRHLGLKLDDPASGLAEVIRCFCLAEDGTLWLGSNGYGIYRRVIDQNGGESFVSYDTSRGLVNNNIRGILEDREGNLWIATNNGLSCFNPSSEHFINYSEQDDLPDSQFYWNASLRTADGTLWFGSVSALTGIMGQFSRSTLAQPAVVRFTRLRIGDQEILPGGKYLSKDIAVTREITIHEREKSFSLEFSALDFEHVDTKIYSYRLLGFEEQWRRIRGGQRSASYTNLHPGTYTLQVKYSLGGEDENAAAKITELKITILPYFFKTVWFIALIVIFAASSIILAFRLRMRSLRRQRELLHRTVERRTLQLEQQKKVLENQTEELSVQNRILTRQNEKITSQKAQISQMAKKVEELNLDKIAFFTNITHEFRTPITLIIGPIERALKLSHNPEVIEQLNFVDRNSKYLLSLVNQLMDFRKVESDKFEIVMGKGNFENFILSQVAPFRMFARERGIEIKVFVRMYDPEIFYDEGGMNKIVSNLLSNAIKFTPDGGTISVYIATLKTRLYICVSDTGTGIEDEDMEHVMERFYQAKNQQHSYGQTGTGIGLYVCQRIVEMLGGEIKARNNPHRGCSFRILVPLVRREPETAVPQTGVQGSMQEIPLAAKSPDVMPSAEGEIQTILVVDDNADMRSYIRTILRDHYNVVEAANGMEALKILGETAVDFIISDLMMPVMDGIELSKRVRKMFATSHIPFLMLTAKTSDEPRLDSYRIGVDEYLHKPFDDTMLLARVGNILENRKRYMRRFGVNMDAAALNLTEPSDKVFVDRILDVMRENYKNPYFDVSDLCEAVGVSKSLLNKKMHSLVGESAGQFIRNYRLNTARELLLANRDTQQKYIAEIAYEVGFNDPKYFTRCFHKRFNMKPRELMHNTGDANKQ
jgi:signal transduction histidine kinase/ligand-binding sensor domain-containing protein/CheY-like chemotaxis protein/AraC-like DNA-binding protein